MRTRPIVIASAAAALALALTACQDSSSGAPSSSSIQNQQQKLTSQAFTKQQAAVPYPAGQLADSLERKNLRERLLRNNQADRISYVYILSYDGKYLGYYTIEGKVSSTQSQMTASQSIIGHSQYGSSDGAVIEAPGDDGSYGQEEDGVFFFLTSGVMVTTDMPYIVSDAPLSVNAPSLNVKATQKPAERK